MQYPIIELITDAYINNGWTGLDIPNTITYEPIQLGSGDPSPDNVRPILPATTLNIGGVDVPVYGGSLDVTTGVLTVDKVEADLGSLNWIADSSTANRKNRFYSASLQNTILLIPSDTTNGARTLCSSLSLLPQNGTYFADNDGYITTSVGRIYVFVDSLSDKTAAEFKTAMDGVQLVYELETTTTYQLTQEELQNAIGIKNDIAHRLKLPLPHYFPHPVIDALQRAAAGTQTADDTEVLRHYLTPLGIGGI